MWIGPEFWRRVPVLVRAAAIALLFAQRHNLSQLNLAPTERILMKDSRHLAGLIGPTMVAIGVTEAINMDSFSTQTAPVVYLNGAILFVSGLAIVRAHNLWSWQWPVLVTLTGWVSMLGGLWRMSAPDAHQASEKVLIYATLAAIGAIGTFLSFKSYGAKASSPREPTDQ